MLLVPLLAAGAVIAAPERVAAERAPAAEDVETRARAALAAIGPRLVRRERALDAARARLAELETAVGAAQRRRREASAALSSLLAATQRAAREPAPAMLVHPGRPAAAARGAVVLRALARRMRGASETAAADAAAIAGALSEAQALERQAAAEFHALQLDETRVRALLAERARGRRRAAAPPPEIAAAPPPPPAVPAAPAAPPAPAVGWEPVGPAAEAPRRAPIERPQPAPAAAPRRFADARGALLRPVAGRIERSRRADRPGLTFHARPFARVIAPWRGDVLYAKSFQRDGMLVIIEPQKGHQILMSGLGRADVRRGDAVFAGEPIGTMGGPPALSNAEFLFEVTRDTRDLRETLYLEILEHGRPRDPAPWLAPDPDRPALARLAATAPTAAGAGGRDREDDGPGAARPGDDER
ncbi:MAG: peptidoglycan DD-metalloendopeptidase family protein [Pseudomonadota bacterium]